MPLSRLRAMAAAPASARAQTSEKDWLLRAVLIATAVVYAVFALRNSFVHEGTRLFTLFDDAMISMRYAKNLADGHGLVWNPGEAPVEGYTNFLWTLWMTVLHWLPVQPSLGVVVSGCAILLGHLLVVHRLALRVGGSSEVATVAVAVIASNYALLFWTLRGFEVGVLALLIDAALLCILSDGPRVRRVLVAALLLSAAVLTRTDALVSTGVVAAALVARMPTRRGLVLATCLLACVLATLFLHTWFRLTYYGAPLPNTYYLKMEGISLDARVARGLGSLAATVACRLLPLLALTAAGFVLGAREGGRVRRSELALLGVFLGQAAYSVYVGGDAWEGFRIENRYLSVALGPLVVLAALGHARLRTHVRRAKRRVLVWIGTVATMVAFIALQVWLASPGALVLAVAVVASTIAGALVLRFARMGRELLPATHASALASLLCIALFLQAFPLVGWARYGATYAGDDAGMSQAGLTLRRATPRDTVVATLSSGSLPYYAERRVLDLLGKCDAAIAHRPPRGVFVPGHNKFDLRHSLSMRPHLVQGLPAGTTEEEAARIEVEYARLPDGWLLRRDAAPALMAALPGLEQGGWYALSR
ncbi:MAG: hypothetical protein ABW252_19665 [Polyangiales bacterium]